MDINLNQFLKSGFIKQLTYIFLFCLLLSACSADKSNNKSSTELAGLWCDGSFFCIFFNNENSFIQRIIFDPYKIKDSTIMVTRADTTEQFPFYLNGTDTLNISYHYKRPWKRYYKSKPLHHQQIKMIQYSQLTPSDAFTLTINEKYEVLLDIVFHRFLEQGQYKKQLDQNYIAFLKEIIKGMPLEVSNNLNPEIHSDKQEWAAIINTQDETEYSIFYNYSDLQINHTYFAGFMDILPLMNGFEKVSLNLKENRALIFREREFGRNLELNKNH